MSFKRTSILISFIIFSITLAIYHTIRHVIRLSLRYLQRSPAPLSPPPQPIVTIKVHDPSQPPKDTILLIHGFPDSPSLWDATVAKLTAQGNRCLVVALPGCNGEPIATALLPSQVATMIETSVRQITTSPVTLLAHDWGCLFGLILTCDKSLFHRMIFVDVGRLSFSPRYGMLSFTTIVTYQLLLAIAFLLGEPEGTSIVRAFMKKADYTVREIGDLTYGMACYYVGFYAAMLLGQTELFEGTIGKETDRRPVLFLYGRKKPFKFHDRKWIDDVSRTPGGAVVPIESGHWVMVDEQETFSKSVGDWLDGTMKFVES